MNPTFYPTLAKSFSNKILRLTIMPTEKCNFRCEYCYERFDKGRMSPGIVLGIKKLIGIRAQDLTSLHLSWFGGEPSLCPDIIRDISKHALEMQKTYGLQYHANMTTNGYLLTRSCLEGHVRVGIRDYQVTLDGYGEDHDATRKMANGRKTFGVIWRNLLSFSKSSLEFCIILRVHFLQDNWRKKIDLLEEIKDSFGQDKRFRVHVIGVSKFGGQNDESMVVATGADKKDIRLELLSHVPQHMREIPEVKYEDYICYAAKGNSFVIRSDGRISKCTVGLYDDKNIVGNIDREGNLVIDDEKIRPWFVGFTEKDRDALACPAKRVLWNY